MSPLERTNFELNVRDGPGEVVGNKRGTNCDNSLKVNLSSLDLPSIQESEKSDLPVLT